MNDTVAQESITLITAPEHASGRKWSIYVLFMSNLISFVGDMLTLLAIPWFVLQTTGSVIQAGITGFCSALPMVLSAFQNSPTTPRTGPTITPTPRLLHRPT